MIFYPLIVAGLIGIIITLNVTNNPPTKAAKVSTVNGLLIFTDCEPINDHTHIANLTVPTGTYKEIILELTTQANKLPNAQGIVFDGSTATVIKFE